MRLTPHIIIKIYEIYKTEEKVMGELKIEHVMY